MKMIKFAVAAISITGVAFCAQAQSKASATKPTQMLQSFCGFKAGEDIKTVKQPSNFGGAAGEFYRARKPFRKFKDVMLEYTDVGLAGITACARIPKMKLAAAKKELDTCCKELSKFGLSFDDQWETTGDVLIQKHGSGKGVPDIGIMGQVDAANPNGVVLQITILWDIRYFQHPPLKVKPAKYNPKSGLSRKAFVENVFGLKFGENAFDKIKPGGQLEKDSYVWCPLSAPVCGIDAVQLFQGEGKELVLISLAPAGGSAPKEKGEADAKAKCAKSLSSISSWLGLAPEEFETNEKSEDRYGAVAYKVTTVESMWHKDGFQIEIRCGWSKAKDSGDIFLTPASICFRQLTMK